MSSISIRRAKKLDPSQRQLLEWIQLLSDAAKKFKFKMTGADIVLKHGSFFTPQPKPDCIPWDPVRLCFMNAANLALSDPGMTYVEGFADSGLMPTEHAWVVDVKGRVFDSTWRKHGLSYFGVPFTTRLLRQSLVANGYYGMFGAMGRLPHVFTLTPRALKLGVKQLP